MGSKVMVACVFSKAVTRSDERSLKGHFSLMNPGGVRCVSHDDVQFTSGYQLPVIQ